MKKAMILILTTLCGLQSWLWADPAGEAPGKGPGFRPRGRLERGGDQKLAGDSSRQPPPVMEYLDRLKESDPERFERLRRLREEDPEAFRQELRKRAWDRNTNGKRSFGNRPHPLREEIENIKNAQNPEEREAAVSQLRAKVSERVEKNLAEREAAIEKFRKELKQLEEQNEQERVRKQEIIDHHLQRILDFIDTPPPND